MVLKRYFMLIMLVTQTVYAQKLPLKSLKAKGERYLEQQSFFLDHKFYELGAGMDFTSFIIQIDEESSFDGAYVIIDDDTVKLQQDAHSPISNGRINSNLISIPDRGRQIKLYSGNITGEIRLHFINGSTDAAYERTVQSEANDDCTTEPSNVPQSNWRAGLASPNYNRSFSNVNHVIIHHSAGSNTNTNYTQVVRDIYLLHTEVNGWSDIGYNYLIAQDGTVYAGRDPNGGAQDDVRGAHFCGMNTGTMGICLLGNYVDTEPTDAAITSLIELATWKLDKQGLNPFDAFPFRSLSSLGALSGHRDGCATECPGQHVYDRIIELKTAIDASLLNCDPNNEFSPSFSASNSEIFTGESVNFTDNSSGTITSWQWTFEGGNPETSTEQNPQSITYANAGIFDVQLIIRGGARIDTVVSADAVEVLEPIPGITVFPNPVAQGAPMTIRINNEHDVQAFITDMSGNTLTIVPETFYNGTLDTSILPKGMYVIHYSDGTKNATQRFLVL